MKKTCFRPMISFALAFMILQCLSPAAKGQEIIMPTCTQDGYAVMRGPDGTAGAVRYMPATGHSFGAWELDADTGECRHTCLVCGTEEVVSLREEGPARLTLSTGETEDGGTGLTISLSGSGSDFEAKGLLSAEGDGYGYLLPDRMTLRLYADDGMEQPLFHTFPGWSADFKYSLTAHPADPTAVRGLAVSALWRQMAASRSALPERLSMLPLRGGTDGFPVTVWLNGVFAGLYTLGPREDADLYGFFQDETAAAALCVGLGADTRFRENTSFDPETGGWRLISAGAEGEQQAKNRINQMIRFIMVSDDSALRENLPSFLDVDGAVDALLLSAALGLTDSRFLTLLYYGDQLIPAVRAPENAFGAEDGGLAFRDAAEGLPKKDRDGWTSGTENLLFDRLVSVFGDRVISRYRQLRRATLTEENLSALLDGLMGAIPDAAYALDALNYPARPSAAEERSRIMTYLRQRLPLLDAAFGGY